jgi:hypothetical protein
MLQCFDNSRNDICVLRPISYTHGNYPSWSINLSTVLNLIIIFFYNTLVSTSVDSLITILFCIHKNITERKYHLYEKLKYRLLIQNNITSIRLTEKRVQHRKVVIYISQF